jgi:hypothetical protein
MKNPGAFTLALNGAYAMAFVVLSCISLIGYWYWGDGANVLVTTDFEEHSPYTRFQVGGVGIHKVVEVIVALNCATTAPLLVLSLHDISVAMLVPAVEHGVREVRFIYISMVSFPAKFCSHP